MARRTPPSAQSGQSGQRNQRGQTQAQRNRQMTRTLAAVRLGATTFGVLGGVACYIVVDQFTAIGMVPAFVLGLVFALLTRTAAASLARDWLVRNANRAANERQGDVPPTTPER